MKNLFQRLPKVFTKHQAKAGSTIIETLAGGIMCIMLVAAAGSGVASIVGNDHQMRTNSNTKLTLQSALTDINKEIKEAQTIQTGGNMTETKASMSAEAGAAFQAAVGEMDYSVLLVDSPNLPAPIVFYLGSNESGTKTVFRWGPDLDINGEFIQPDDLASWKARPIKDKITDNLLPSDFSCETDWQLSPANGQEGSVSAAGFYACISPDGKMANVFLNANMLNIHGSGDTLEQNQKATAEADDFKIIAGPPPKLNAKAIAGVPELVAGAPQQADCTVTSKKQLLCNNSNSDLGDLGFKEVAKIEFSSFTSITPNEYEPGYADSFSVTYTDTEGGESRRGEYSINSNIEGHVILKLKAGTGAEYYLLEDIHSNENYSGYWSTEGLDNKGISHISLYILDDNTTVLAESNTEGEVEAENTDNGGKGRGKGKK